MSNKMGKITLQDVLYGEFERSITNSTTEASELLLDLKELYGTLEGLEFVEAFIARVQRYAVACVNLSIDDDFADIDSGSLLQIALSEDTDALVSVLERLTGALKASGKPRALGEGSEALVLPQDK